MPSLSSAFVAWTAIFWLFTTANAAVDDVVCRYTATTPLTVNYYTCTDFADYYHILINKFFELNPSVTPECDNIKPNVEYCVAGFLQVPISTDGFCGSQYGNASCVGTDKQCCNSATWQCGDTTEDCAAGTCYGGACVGDPNLYSLDGECGPSTGNLICTGKWGECCNYGGLCGSGSDFCSKANCQSGACYQLPMPKPTDVSPFGTTPDGSCGGSEGYTGGVIFGNCCNKDNKCGLTPLDCGTGCDSGTTAHPTPSKPAQPSTTSRTSPDGSCGGTNNYTCKGSSFGDCCSLSNFCGDTTDHRSGGCQPAFGSCKTLDASPDGTYGGSKRYNCKDSPLGDCCSASGFCGSSTGHCGGGCQAGYGSCTADDVSSDGICGGSKGYKCLGSGFGDCCSSAGYCGSTNDHCEARCQMDFGRCTVAGVPVLILDPETGTYIIPTASPPTSKKHSEDGSCGGLQGLKCAGTSFGECCSAVGYCGSSISHCAQGCQTPFSSACLSSKVPSVDGTCGSGNGDLTCAGGPFEGRCCSVGGWCGSDADHCNSGCQKGYGTCN